MQFQIAGVTHVRILFVRRRQSYPHHIDSTKIFITENILNLQNNRLNNKTNKKK